MKTAGESILCGEICASRSSIIVHFVAGERTHSRAQGRPPPPLLPLHATNRAMADRSTDRTDSINIWSWLSLRIKGQGYVELFAINRKQSVTCWYTCFKGMEILVEWCDINYSPEGGQRVDRPAGCLVPMIVRRVAWRASVRRPADGGSRASRRVIRRLQPAVVCRRLERLQGLCAMEESDMCVWVLLPKLNVEGMARAL